MSNEGEKCQECNWYNWDIDEEVYSCTLEKCILDERLDKE